MPRGRDGSFSRSKRLLSWDHTHEKPTEKPKSVQDNWIIASGLFKNKDRNMRMCCLNI